MLLRVSTQFRNKGTNEQVPKLLCMRFTLQLFTFDGSGTENRFGQSSQAGNIEAFCR